MAKGPGGNRAGAVSSIPQQVARCRTLAAVRSRRTGSGLSLGGACEFEGRLNGFFVEKGIGRELRNGRITNRGSGAFTRSTHEVPVRLDGSGAQRAANEMREALQDISRRPEPDINGAVQHAMAALEATAREVAGQPNPTPGQLAPSLALPAPLDRAVHKLWGYAFDHGRHIREQQSVDHAEAEFIVAVGGSLCAFPVQRRS